MKTVLNLTFKPDNEKEPPSTTAKLLVVCLKSMPERGFDFTEIRARQRIFDVIENVQDGGEIQLEDADHAKVVECVRASRWVEPSKHLITFAEQFGL